MVVGALLLAAAAAAPKIAVLDVRTGQGVDPAMAGFLTQIIAGEVAQRTGAAPLVSADILAMLGFEKRKQMLGCADDDSSCLAEIGGALGVQRIVATSVAVSGGRYLITMSLLDAQKARPLSRDAESARRDDDELVKMLRWSAYRIFGGAAPAAPETPWTRRSWAGVALGAAGALAAGGVSAGLVALHQSQRGDPIARPRAHLADALFAGSLLCAGGALYLATSHDGPMAALAVRW